MSAGTNRIISNAGSDVPTIEVDIAMSPSNICWIVAAATNQNDHRIDITGPLPIVILAGGPLKIFYTTDMGAT
jgi:hypothetical protein